MKNMIYPCLWFDGNAKEAADFYCNVFNDSEITSENHMVVTFEASGQKFMCLNGGPQFQLNPSISFVVMCETDEELERTWEAFLKGGSVLMPKDKYEWSEKYGWVMDKFGVSWQLSLGKVEQQKFTPDFLFTGNQNGKAEEAIHFYTSVFRNSDILGIWRYTKEDNDIEGNIKHAQFKLEEQFFMMMESSLPHQFTFNEAISLVVECQDQQEVDYFWDRLTDGGREDQCGWLKDRYGVSWQIVPAILEKLMSDPSKAQRVVNAFMQMKKFEIDKLVNA